MARSGAAPQVKGNERVVWVLHEGEASPVTVRVGVSDGVVSESLEGNLQPGDLVVTEAIAPSNSGPGSYGRVF
jgi:multidrug efflux pump subunit AcrA (membrane-fusion protein)